MSQGHRLNSTLRRSLLWLLLGTHAGLLAWSATQISPTWDEPGHLAAGLSQWRFGRFELYSVNPPLVRVVAAAPVLALCDPLLDWRDYHPDPKRRSETRVGRRLIELNGPRSIEFFIAARWACIPFSLLGAWICCRWSRELYGDVASLFAASLWCFSPMILGHGQLITPDVGATALGVTALYVFRKWLMSPAWSYALLSGVTLGAAFLAKFTWLFVCPLWAVAWITWRGRTWWKGSRRHKLAAVSQLLLVGVVAILILNTFYTFQGTGKRLGEFSFMSDLLAGPADQRDSKGQGNLFRGTWLASMPAPLPEHVLLGIDVQKHDMDRAKTDSGWEAYFAGEWRSGGWWWFYLGALVVKEPLGGWFLLLLAAFFRMTRLRRETSWREDVLLWLPVLCILLLASSQSLQRHLRYILPVYPFAMIWTSQVVRGVTGLRSVATLAVAGSWLWYLGSSLWVYPHSLAYFNEVAGGPRHGAQFLIDSNLDWGQDLLRLRDWLDRHPEIKRIGLAYYGCPDPAHFGIRDFFVPPLVPEEPDRLLAGDSRPFGPQPGWFAVSESLRVGISMPIADESGRFRHFGQPVFTYFSEFEPVDRIGYSIYVYHLELSEVNAVRRKLNLPVIR